MIAIFSIFIFLRVSFFCYRAISPNNSNKRTMLLSSYAKTGTTLKIKKW